MHQSSRICARGAVLCLFRVATLLCLVFSSISYAQSTQRPSTVPGSSTLSHGQTHRAPLSHIYYHVALYQSHLDSEAAKLEKQSKDGSSLRAFLQQKLGFTDSEYAPIREYAQRVGPALQSIDNQIKPLLETDKQLRSSGWVAKTDPAPGRERIRALQQEREDALTAEMNRLDDDLGPENATRFKTFLNTQISSTPDQGHGPSLHKPAPYKAIAKPGSTKATTPVSTSANVEVR